MTTTQANVNSASARCPIATSFGAQVLIVPRATGLDALAWALPAAALVCALAGLAVAFRRWRLESASARGATAEDQALVDAALAAEAPHDQPPS